MDFYSIYLIFLSFVTSIEMKGKLLPEGNIRRLQGPSSIATTALSVLCVMLKQSSGVLEPSNNSEEIGETTAEEESWRYEEQRDKRLSLAAIQCFIVVQRGSS